MTTGPTAMNTATIARRIADNSRILTGLGLAFVFLVVETAVHVTVFHHHDTIMNEIFTSGLPENLLRLTIIILFLAFAVHAQIAGKKQAARERALVDAGIEWELTFNAMPEFIAIMDTEFRIRRINNAMARRLGAEPETIIGSTCYERIHGTDQPPSYCPYQSLLRDCTVHNAEIHEERLGGDYEITVSPLLDRDGCLVGCTHVARDISPLKHAEAELRKNNNALQRQLQFTQTLLETEPTAVFFKDAEGRYMGCNKEFAKIVGVTPDQIIGKTVFDLWPAELAEVYHLQDNALLGNPCHQTYEFKVRKAGGELIDVIFNKNVFLDESGAAGGIIGTLLDITYLKKGEEKIRELNEDLERRVDERTNQLQREIAEHKEAEKKLALMNSALDRVSESVHLIDENGYFHYVNEEFCRLMGYTRNELYLITVGHIDPVVDLSLWPQLWGMLRESGSVHIERFYRSKDGRIFPVEITATLFTYGDSDYCIAISRDITDRKLAEQERRAYTDRLRSFSSRLMVAREAERRLIARELHDEAGQSLTGIKLAIEDIRRATGAIASEKIDTVQQELGELMIRLKDISMSLRPSMLDNLGLLSALEWYIERYQDKSGMDVDFRHSGLNRPFHRDISLIVFRVVQEALTNIVRHSGAKTARITVSAHNKELFITIRDDGLGFDTDRAMKGKETLGLIGMRERVQDIGGTFRVSSTLGAGSEISCRMPLDYFSSQSSGGRDADCDR